MILAINLKEQTPLHVAVQHCDGDGAPSLIVLLLQHGASMEARDELGMTPLALAASYGTQGVPCLVAARAEKEARNALGHTPLILAARNGHLLSVNVFGYDGANFEIRDIIFDRTPMAWAADGNHVHIIDALVGFGGKLEAKDTMGETPLLVAASAGHVEAMDALLKHGADLDARSDDGGSVLHAVTGGCGHQPIDAIRFLLGHEVYIHYRERQGRPITIEAIEEDETVKAEYRAYQLAQVNGQDSYGRTPLYWAAFYPCREVAMCLIEYGADVSISNITGRELWEIAGSTGDDRLKGRRGGVDPILVDYLKQELGAHHEREALKEQEVST